MDREKKSKEKTVVNCSANNNLLILAFVVSAFEIFIIVIVRWNLPWNRNKWNAFFYESDFQEMINVGLRFRAPFPYDTFQVI